jgi:polysaccharide export outer membrane protein
VVDANYRIGTNDEVEVNVFDVAELNLTQKVRDSGFLSLPLIGAVKAVGLTEGELQDEIHQRLSKFIRDPQVSVFISNYGSQNVAVLGAVQKPGTYPLQKGQNSLLELVGRAGGLTERAGGFLNFVPYEVSGLAASNDVEARAKLSLASYDQSKLKGSGVEIAMDKVLGTGGGNSCRATC